jgi:hypothetical protein
VAPVIVLVRPSSNSPDIQFGALIRAPDGSTCGVWPVARSCCQIA